jgi:AcrR family transcriptional regulator
MTSTTTFYRYFPTKEDVVLDNDASPHFENTIATRPADEPLTATIRAAMAAVVAAADRDLIWSEVCQEGVLNRPVCWW